MLEKGEGWNRKFPFRVGFCADRCSRHIPGPSRLFFLFLSFLCLCTSLSGLAGLCGRTPSKYSLEEHLWAGVEILWKNWLCSGQSPFNLDGLLRGLGILYPTILISMISTKRDIFGETRSYWRAWFTPLHPKQWHVYYVYLPERIRCVIWCRHVTSCRKG